MVWMPNTAAPTAKKTRMNVPTPSASALRVVSGAGAVERVGAGAVSAMDFPDS